MTVINLQGVRLISLIEGAKVQNPFYAITTCIKKTGPSKNHSICHFNGFYNGKKIISLLVIGEKNVSLEFGKEYFLLLEYKSIDNDGVLTADLIDFEQLGSLKIKDCPTI